MQRSLRPAFPKGLTMIGSVMMCASVALFLLGMLGGIVMGIQHDFTLGPAHAHLNLIGGVMLFLFGLYYRLVPGAAAGRLPRIQGGLHIVGAVLFPLGIALSITQGPAYMPVPVVGSLVVTAAVALFGIIVIRTARAEARPLRHPHPTDRRHGPHPASHSQPFHGIVQHSDSSGAGRRQDLRTDSQTHGQGIKG
ncbi:cbb3-type cytochrome c oxidase subunit I [Rhodopseudomonas palustris]|uniref:cbb3-type cytochrome c oxidase subunit I n=1 Tax=Rhodopseudomonas palustris TaxID=1076 RepID=UPI001F1EE4C3|nr:cbb3-type cytochrome c oxidase subunit I [Rhodopseudomonas palustris]